MREELGKWGKGETILVILALIGLIKVLQWAYVGLGVIVGWIS